NVFLKSNLAAKVTRYVTLSDQRERRVLEKAACKRRFWGFLVASLLGMTFKKHALNKGEPWIQGSP
ncbi:MAG: hypothetical protein AB1801_03235, partial [Chloroflexota bacterium]